ncbi:M48 family metallopeptidase [Methylomonas rhizoryzae]|uniref:M48 family metallopeptidase n=1 Tax=Methylomonas rhizoryzae TaxID=2608981 RepID=UPI0012320ED1|nr:M48 family metallopeptidase [Methylomonas rhizoryzae]
MTSGSVYNGLYYAGRDKFQVQFRVTGHGILEFDVAERGRLEIPVQKTTLDLIGDPGTTLQMRWSTDDLRHALLCNQPALLNELSALNLPRATLTQLAILQAKQRKSLKGETHRVPVYLSLIAAFFVGGYFALQYSTPLLADLIPYQWEQKIGAFALENYRLGKKTVDDPAVIDAVNTIVNRINNFDDADIEYQPAVVDADMINAFAFPGGYVVVTTGLIENADNPEQVAGVLAHELTHVIERHSMRKLLRHAGMGVLIGIVFGDVSALSQLIELSAQLDSLSFDRDQERSADEGAIKIMSAAGLSPKHLATFFEKLPKADALTGSIPQLFQTHPLTDDRIERVAQATEPEQLFTFAMDWDEVKRRVKRPEAARASGK